MFSMSFCLPCYAAITLRDNVGKIWKVMKQKKKNKNTTQKWKRGKANHFSHFCLFVFLFGCVFLVLNILTADKKLCCLFTADKESIFYTAWAAGGSGSVCMCERGNLSR